MGTRVMVLLGRILPPRRFLGSSRLSAYDLACALILAAGSGPAFAQGTPRVPTRALVIATGGTIAGEQAQPGTFGTYAVKKSVSDLVALVPNLPQYAEVEMEQFSNISNPAITPDDWLQLAQQINRRLTERSDLAGVVVTHGTSRLAETAFFSAPHDSVRPCGRGRGCTAATDRDQPRWCHQSACGIRRGGACLSRQRGHGREG
jgi:hypothetical protein